MMLETEVFDIEPDITVVSCAGRFTLGTQLRLTESMINTLIQKGSRKLVVDLTHTELVDSAGLGVLMHVFGEMEQLGGPCGWPAPTTGLPTCSTSPTPTES